MRTNSARALLALVFAGAFVALTPNGASATVLDFTSVPCQSQFGNVSSFTFSSNWATECNTDYTDPGSWNNSAANGAPSGIAAGNIYYDATGVTITRGAPFNLVGGLASSFLTNDGFDYTTPLSSASLLIYGYLGNTFVGSVLTTFDPTPGYVPLAGSLFGVDRLEFFSFFDQGLSAAGPDYWLIDNLNLTDVTTTVPEPGSVLMLATGLLIVGAKLRSRRRKAARSAERS
jgi:hypothetical protein